LLRLERARHRNPLLRGLIASDILLGPANAALSGGLLLGILDPADEFVAG
jgi:hypothetical protein